MTCPVVFGIWRSGFELSKVLASTRVTVILVTNSFTLAAFRSSLTTKIYVGREASVYFTINKLPYLRIIVQLPIYLS
jgi:hypothetical protein